MKIDSNDAKNLLNEYRIRFFPPLKHQCKVSGMNALFEEKTQHRPGEFMPLGAYSYSRSFFSNVRRIGRYCSIGSGVEIMGAAHPIDWISTSPVFYRKRRARQWGSNRKNFPEFSDLGAPVEIGENVWIGDGALLAHGIKISTGAIVAARSVVTKDVPPYAIVSGVPARIVRYVHNERTVERLLDSKWWKWPVSVWDEIDPRDIEAVIGLAQELRETHSIYVERRHKIADLLQGIGKTCSS